MRDTTEPIVRRNKSISGKLSVGIYMVDRQTDTMADALHKADVALYQAKADGRNTYRLFTEDMETGIRARRELEQLIRTATAQEGFELHYQPLLHAKSGACAGFEALLRLPDGKGGYISPFTYISVIEAMGLINAVGKMGDRGKLGAPPRPGRRISLSRSIFRSSSLRTVRLPDM